jgi:hypothetical protein
VPLLARHRLEVADLEWVRWFRLPDVQVVGLQPSIGGRCQSAEPNASSLVASIQNASNLPATKPHIATYCTVSLRRHPLPDQP